MDSWGQMGPGKLPPWNAWIIFLSAPLLYSAGYPSNYGAYVITLAVLIFTSIAWGLLIGVTSRGQAMATMLSQAVFLPSLLLSGIMFPASMLPGFLNGVGVIFPATHAMRSFSELAFNVTPGYNGELALGVLALLGIAAMCIAIWRFAKIGSEA